jgi:hypothetical protein
MSYKTKQQRLDYQRAWYAKNKKKQNAYFRKRYANRKQEESDRKKIYWANNRDKILTRQRKYRLENKDKTYQYFKKFLSNPVNQKKANARSLVYYAIKRGKLLKQTCFCGEIKVEAHHEDYNKPLEVIWLCRLHHVEADKKCKQKYITTEI